MGREEPVGEPGHRRRHGLHVQRRRPARLRDTTKFTWSWGASLPQLLYDGSTNYVYGLGRIMEADASGNPQAYYLYDVPRLRPNVADASGNVLVSYTYDAFGAVRTQSVH